jgi:arginyl-tRNA synthetase
VSSPLDDLRAAVLDSAAELCAGRPAPVAAPTLERPPRAELGDYSTNAAMLLAPVLKAAPRAIAADLGSGLSARLGDRVDRVEIAGPGFLNVFLADGWYAEATGRVLAAGDAFGQGAPERPERVNVEFVSANPTGPLTAASGRHAAYGDALSRILELAGHTVDREYYVNDAGTQIRLLGESIQARALGRPVPADGYQGDYVAELAAEIEGAADPEADVDALASAGIERMFERVRATLETYRVAFDIFFRESSLYEGDPTPCSARSPRSRRAAGCTATRAPCGCAPRSSATTRTASSSAPRASRPTSPPTSPTSGTSSSARTTGSSTSWAPTTTATSGACGPPPPRWRPTPTGWRSRSCSSCT